MSMAERIRDRRVELGLSQEAVARATGLSTGTYRMIELGQTHSPGILTLQLIAKALGTTIAWLVGESEDPESSAPPSAQP